MEKTNLEIRKNNRQENRRVDDIRTTSVTFDNPIWQLLEEMEEPRPYKTSDFNEEDEEAEAYILKDTSKAEDTEAVYEFVESEEELDAVSRIFAELLEDMDLE